MSLQRLLLRAAWVGALKDVTVAQDRVFDSRLGPITQSAVDDLLPCISVYSDLDKRDNVSQSDLTPTFKRKVDIVLELSIGAWRTHTVQGPQGNPEQVKVFSLLETDAELEMALDLMEMQILRAFYADGKAASFLRRLTKSLISWDSIPGRSPPAEGNIKITTRQITISCEISDECSEALAGFARLPGAKPGAGSIFPALAGLAPHLVPMLEQMAQVPTFASMRDMLAELNGDKPLPELKPGIRFFMRFFREPDHVDVTADTTQP